MKKIMAFESSCDDTAIAIVNENGEILSDLMYSQVSEYAVFGGVVPEIGSRAHIEQISGLSKKALSLASLSAKDIDIVAATFAPGLIGPLLVGANFAKAFSLARGIPLIAVHHIAGHVLSGFGEPDFPPPPFVALIAAGGHTALYRCDENYRISLIGQTLDDAAGEAFDKIGRALGLLYPAGKEMDRLARSGNPSRFKFSVAMKNESHFNFSFSGLKTQAIQCIRAESPFDLSTMQDLCASVEYSIAEALTLRAMRALKTLGLKNLVIGGGVAANTKLREMLKERCEEQKIALFLPEKRLCTDNAVMIARAAIIALRQKKSTPLTVDVRASLAIEDADLLYPTF